MKESKVEEECEANIRRCQMKTVQRIAENTGVLLASQVESYILGFFLLGF